MYHYPLYNLLYMFTSAGSLITSVSSAYALSDVSVEVKNSCEAPLVRRDREGGAGSVTYNATLKHTSLYMYMYVKCILTCTYTICTQKTILKKGQLQAGTQ